MTDHRNEQGTAKQDAAELHPDVQERLGAKLRETYNGVVSEPLPERFTRLLEQLMETSGNTGDGQ